MHHPVNPAKAGKDILPRGGKGGGIARVNLHIGRTRAKGGKTILMRHDGCIGGRPA